MWSASAQLSPRPLLLLLPLGGLMPARGVGGAMPAKGVGGSVDAVEVPAAPRCAKLERVTSWMVPAGGSVGGVCCNVVAVGGWS